MKTILSGLKPTGEMTIGNYIGAMKHWPLTQGKGNKTIFFVPNALDLAAWLLTVGIDPKESTILIQSMVSAHSELFWILDNYVTMGELNRMTQFKDKSKKLGPEGQLVGLYSYPVLMAADILLYDSNEVPVGEDQIQHVELTRDIANRFNKLYGDTFVLPKATVPKYGARIMSLDEPSVKMSKSDHPDSYIALGEDKDSVIKKFKRAVTDSDSVVSYDKAAKPAISNLIEIYIGFTDKSIEEVEVLYEGKRYGEFKQDLGIIVSDKLAELQHKFEDYRADEASLIEILEQGSAKARQIADKKIIEVKSKIGLL